MTLTPPNVAGWTVLTDPNPGANWTPPMVANTDYVLLPSGKRDHQLILQGGRNIYMPGWHTTRGDTNGGPNIMLDGRSSPGTVFLHGCLGDASGTFESDYIRSRSSQIQPDRGSGLTKLAMLDCRVWGLRGQTNGATDDFGQVSAATHADVIQLAGGLGDCELDHCTFHSRYSCLQLQQEQVEAGAYGTVTSLTRAANIATMQTAAAHGLVVGEFVQVGNGVQAGGVDTNPSGWSGTYMVLTVPDATHLTYNLGDRTPAALINGGTATWKKSTKPYTVGNITVTNTNLVMDVNGQQFASLAPGETLNAMRFGGRPDYKGWEDQTPMTADAWAGAANLTNVYLQLYNAGAGAVINPGSSGSIYSGVRGSLAGGAYTWPGWAAVTGQVTIGAPPGGDFCPAWRPGLRFPGARARGRV